MKTILLLVLICFGCNITFEQRVGGMKRPIIVVAEDCNNYSGTTYCTIILRDSAGRMATLNSDQFANSIAKNYEVGDTLK